MSTSHIPTDQLVACRIAQLLIGQGWTAEKAGDMARKYVANHSGRESHGADAANTARYPLSDAPELPVRMAAEERTLRQARRDVAAKILAATE